MQIKRLYHLEIPVVIVVVCFLLSLVGAEEFDKSPMSNTINTNKTSEKTVVKEEFVKLTKYNSLVDQMNDMHSALAAATIKIGALNPTNRFGRLLDMERKSFLYETVSIKVRQQERLIEELKKNVKTANVIVGQKEAKCDILDQRVNELTAYVKKLQKEQAPLRKALELIRLGQYEYYEVKQGDTCRSIAAQPTVYGDPEKDVLIRQANRGGVADIDNLKAKEMLIIPHFSMSKRYDL